MKLIFLLEVVVLSFVYILFPLYPLPPLLCFFCIGLFPIHFMSSFLFVQLVSMSICLSLVCFFLALTLTRSGKPRERDFLKTLRLVSSAEACAVEQHGHEQDDDKGVGVVHHPPPCNTTNAARAVDINESGTTIPPQAFYFSGP